MKETELGREKDGDDLNEDKEVRESRKRERESDIKKEEVRKTEVQDYNYKNKSQKHGLEGGDFSCRINVSRVRSLACT